MFPVGGLLFTLDDFPLVWNILSSPQLLFGFYSIQKLRQSCKSCKPFKLTYRRFASLNVVQIWQTHSKTTNITLTICKKNVLFSYFVTFLLRASILPCTFLSSVTDNTPETLRLNVLQIYKSYLKINVYHQTPLRRVCGIKWLKGGVTP